jgi:hypothetical protein
MVSVKEVLGMVVAGVTMYAVLWTFPELTTKGIATAITIVLVGYVGVHTLYTRLLSTRSMTRGKASPG